MKKVCPFIVRTVHRETRKKIFFNIQKLLNKLKINHDSRTEHFSNVEIPQEYDFFKIKKGSYASRQKAKVFDLPEKL
jgi:hypothetical protein